VLQRKIGGVKAGQTVSKDLVSFYSTYLLLLPSPLLTINRKNAYLQASEPKLPLAIPPSRSTSPAKP
jgi:hypothetical protein